MAYIVIGAYDDYAEVFHYLKHFDNTEQARVYVQTLIRQESRSFSSKRMAKRILEQPIEAAADNGDGCCDMNRFTKTFPSALYYWINPAFTDWDTGFAIVEQDEDDSDDEDEEKDEDEDEDDGKEGEGFGLFFKHRMAEPTKINMNAIVDAWKALTPEQREEYQSK